MEALELTKLQLLSHSKNMLDAAQKKDWERFSALDQVWITLLRSSVQRYGDALTQTGAELLKDNQQIQACMNKEQKSLLSRLGEDTKKIASVKSYLK